MPTVFVDRDGVINGERPGYVRTWEQLEFLPHALEGLARLARNSWRVVVMTNQSAVNRGFLSADALTALHRQMARAIAALPEGCGGVVADLLAAARYLVGGSAGNATRDSLLGGDPGC